MGFYNVKLISYPNGTTQIRKYSKPLHTKKALNEYETFSFGEEEQMKRCGIVPKYFESGSYYVDGVLHKDYDIYTVNAFDKNISKHLPNTEKKKNEQNKISDLIHSLNRTKNKIYSYARCVRWEWFVTFTFSSEKTDRYDYTECSRLIRRWLNNQRRNAPDLLYLIVPEQHKDGAWHFHGLLANTGNIEFSDSGKKDGTGKKIYNMAKWLNGWTTATAVGDIHKVASYIGKYITKDLCKATTGKQRYFVSQNMPEPEVSVFLFDGVRDLTPEECENIKQIEMNNPDDIKRMEEISAYYKTIYTKENIQKEEQKRFWEFIAMMADSLGQEVSHISTPRHENAFVDVNYIELTESKGTYE